MHSNRDSINIEKKGEFHVLYIDGAERASVQRKPNGQVKFYFNPVGSFDYQEAKNWLCGLLELSVIADQLSGEKR